jgi:23S rRNA-intervening sequence protein
MIAMTAPPGGERPAYKSHPLWSRAIALTHEAYRLSDAIRARDAATATTLRRAAVTIPAHVASALSSSGRRREEEALAARGALAEVARQARRDDSPAARRLESAAAELDARFLFDFAAEDGTFS